MTGHAGIRSVDKETALNAVKAERNLSDVDTANFYIGSVSSYINEGYCPVDTAAANALQWLNSDVEKWLVFANEEPLLTWQHKCTYYYVPKSYDEAEEIPVFEVEGILPPSGQHLCLFEKNIKKYSTVSKFKSSTSYNLQPQSNQYSAKTHAVLVSYAYGDYTNGRYQVCANAYNMLREVYGIPKENISLLLDDGSSPILDEGGETLSHDIDGDGVNEDVREPTIDNLHQAISGLRDKTDLFLFFYVGETNYNEWAKVDKAPLVFKRTNQYNGYLTSENLYDILDYINAGFNDVVLVAQSSNSFSSGNDNTVTTRSSGDFHFNPTEQQQQAFANTWISCFCKYNKQGLSVADADKDGYVTMAEAFDFANDSVKELYAGNFPTLRSSPQALKSYLSFNRIPTASVPTVRDNVGDTGAEPNCSSNVLWCSPDIWVRNQADGFEYAESEPIKGDSTGSVYVYTRINNKGVNTTNGQQRYYLNLYWAAKNIGGDFGTFANSGTRQGGKISITKFNKQIEPGQSVVFCQKWTLPDYLQSRIADNGGVLDVDIAAIVIADGEAVEIGNFDFAAHNTSAHNAVTVINPSCGTISNGDGFNEKDGVKIPVVISNSSDEVKTYQLSLKREGSASDGDAFKFSEITLYLGNKLNATWIANGKAGTGIKYYSGEPNRIYLKGIDNTVDGLTLSANSKDTIYVTVQAYAASYVSVKCDDTFSLVLTDSDGDVTGGTAFRVIRQAEGTTSGGVLDPSIDVEIPGGSNVGLLAARNISEPVAFKWMDESHNTLGTGSSLAVDLAKKAQSYILKVTTLGGNAVAYASTDALGIKISSVSPNPCTSQISVKLSAPASSATSIVVTSLNGLGSTAVAVAQGKTSVDVSLSSLPSGNFAVSLVVDGTTVSTEQIVKL